MRFSRSLLIASLFLSACASDKVDLNSSAATPTNVKSADTGADSSTNSNSNTNTVPISGNTTDSTSMGNNTTSVQNDNNKAGFDVNKTFSVYFDFDRFDVKPEYAYIIQGWSVWATANPAQKLVIQGNTDERGGREYNLALGQKRAEAVLKALKLSGVDESRLDAISFGKEKPMATGSDESAWGKNRRADIVRK
jgi:peptidoglycan-associated lipoprotein